MAMLYVQATSLHWATVITSLFVGNILIRCIMKMKKNDKYDVFFSGAVPIITAENPLNPDGKELVIFRDSYGRSILPLMVEDYAKITVIDIRYQIPQILLMGVNFENADVLFLYSTLILNNSSELK